MGWVTTYQLVLGTKNCRNHIVSTNNWDEAAIWNMKDAVGKETKYFMKIREVPPQGSVKQNLKQLECKKKLTVKGLKVYVSTQQNYIQMEKKIMIVVFPEYQELSHHM